MNRRRVLTALAGLGLTGGSMWALQGGWLTTRETGLPVRVETLDAPGSTAGRTRVPIPGKPTVIDLFATWCTPCIRQMDALATVNAEYGDRVAFVSVTNERVGGSLTKADIRAWWRQHDGDWTVGLDPESDVMTALGASGLPFLALADGNGAIRWRHAGVTNAATLRGELDALLQEA